MNSDRLIHLKDILLTYEGKFDFMLWQYCAAGIAAQDPIFREQGLWWKQLPSGNWGIRYKQIGGDSFDAVQFFFGLSGHQAHNIFSAGGYNTTDVTKEMVIERIQEVIDGKF